MNATQAEISIDNGPAVPGTLTIEVERIDVTMSTKSEPDLRWEYVDRANHFHAFATDGTLPTLDTRSEHIDCEGHGDDEYECDGYDVTVYSCAICGEIVEPKRIVSHPPPGSEMIPGRMSWQVTVSADVERGSRVSVKVTDARSVQFGVGVATSRSAQGGSDGVHVTTTIVGAGPLGQRKAGSRKGIAA